MSLRSTTPCIVSQHSSAQSGSARVHAFLLILVFLLLGANLARLESNFSFAQNKPAVLSATGTAATQSTLTTGNGQGGQASVQIQTARACTGTRFTLPTALDIANSPAGLTKQIDAPTYYQVYGSSMNDLRAAVENCPLRAAAGNFHAETAYGLNWSYSMTASGSACTLADVRVGVHVTQYFPLFVATATTRSSVSNTWNTYATNLKTHEDGHTAIDIAYAQRITTALQQLTTSNCSTIDQRVQTTVNTYVSELNNANNQYDAQTNHGATQGAVL